MDSKVTKYSHKVAKLATVIMPPVQKSNFHFNNTDELYLAASEMNLMKALVQSNHCFGRRSSLRQKTSLRLRATAAQCSTVPQSLKKRTIVIITNIGSTMRDVCIGSSFAQRLERNKAECKSYDVCARNVIRPRLGRM